MLDVVALYGLAVDDTAENVAVDAGSTPPDPMRCMLLFMLKYSVVPKMANLRTAVLPVRMGVARLADPAGTSSKHGAVELPT